MKAIITITGNSPPEPLEIDLEPRFESEDIAGHVEARLLDLDCLNDTLVPCRVTVEIEVRN